MERTVRTPDGRTLAVEDAGDPAGRPVLVHMGSPNSRHMYGPNVADAAGRGLRLISYDRPGYGGSTPQPGHSVADCAGTLVDLALSSGGQVNSTNKDEVGGSSPPRPTIQIPRLAVKSAGLPQPQEAYLPFRDRCVRSLPSDA